MSKNQHLLIKVWNTHPGFLKSESQVYRSPSIDKIMAEIFSVGEYYHYTIHLPDSSLSNHHPNLGKMHGFEAPPQNLGDIIELVHPDDINFVQEAELMTVEKMKEIGFEHMMHLKSSYCFRMRMASGAYEMFHHQSIPTVRSEEGEFLEAVNIHTHIHHLAPKNNYHVVVSGIGERNDFHKMQWPPNLELHSKPHGLSRRETEIIALLAKGFNTMQISERLCISIHTVRTHRKNILQKTKCRNSSELIGKAFEGGYL
ncbi:response regulator transcription factor [Chryseobacterium sp. R2A-55]|uniref:response regulator transcription factor n=1 Tax=Chryseobacterium sp. R2A-55 TaxID=2744445 RepID=UPI001F33A8AB|nr:helix-turn-helix transcriptional regulator [Chryseobacterium sp. R2A-55]